MPIVKNAGNDLSSRKIDPALLSIKDAEQSLALVKISGDHISASYVTSFTLGDGTVLTNGATSVDRSISAASDDSVNYNGADIALSDLLSIAQMFTDMWLAEDAAANARALANVFANVGSLSIAPAG